MDSLKAFLSICELINTESNLHAGNPTILLQNDQPARVFDSERQSQPFSIMLVNDPESLTKEEVTTLALIAEQVQWIVVVDHLNQVVGIVGPQSIDDLQIAASATIRQGEFGSAIAPPLPGIKVSASSEPKLSVGDFRSLREWWHQVLRDHGRFRCYAFILCLPSDKEVVKYLTSFGKELDILSHENCLVIALSQTGFRRSGYDEAVWNLALNEQISKGFSMTVAQLFNIKYTDFPCIVFFEDIRSSKGMVLSFKGLEAEEIARQIRMIFTVIEQSITSGGKPISALERHQSSERINKVGQSVFSKLVGFAGETFKSAMEEWINKRM